jgi:hypothetical protein
VHGAGDNVPGFTRADWLVRLAPLQDRKTAFQQLSGIETRVCVQPGIYVWRHLDKHHHRFVATIGHVEFFHDGARDWLRHYIPPELADTIVKQQPIRKASKTLKAKSAPQIPSKTHADRHDRNR